MQQDKICPACKVKISSDLSNCPLCGRFVGEESGTQKNKKSYPIYDTKFVQKYTWFAILRALFWAAAIISAVVNIIFPTKIAWCPYVISALIMVFFVFIRPIKVSVSNYIKSLTAMSILVAIFLIFIDAYNHFSFDTPFGWAMSYSAPFVMLAGVVASSIICLFTRRFERELLISAGTMAVFSILYFVVMVCFFPQLALWASLVLMCSSSGLVVILNIFKRRKMFNEISREFHI